MNPYLFDPSATHRLSAFGPGADPGRAADTGQRSPIAQTVRVVLRELSAGLQARLIADALPAYLPRQQVRPARAEPGCSIGRICCATGCAAT